MQPASTAAFRIHRFRPRLTRRQRLGSAAALAGGAALALGMWPLASRGALAPLMATAGSALALGIGAALAHGVRGGFEALREPREYRRALALLKNGDRAGALAATERAIAETPDAFSPWTLRGLLLSEEGEFEASLASYRGAIERRRESWIGHSGAGAALLNLGRLPEAVESLGKALALGATWPVPRYQLGLALFLRGEYAGAAEAFAEALALGLESANVEFIARRLRVFALERTGSAEAAREEKARLAPLERSTEIASYRERLKGANLSPVGRLAAWAVGADPSPDPPRL